MKTPSFFSIPIPPLAKIITSHTDNTECELVLVCVISIQLFIFYFLFVCVAELEYRIRYYSTHSTTTDEFMRLHSDLPSEYSHENTLSHSFFSITISPLAKIIATPPANLYATSIQLFFFIFIFCDTEVEYSLVQDLLLPNPQHYHLLQVNKNCVITCYKYCVLLSNRLNRLFLL